MASWNYTGPAAPLDGRSPKPKSRRTELKDDLDAADNKAILAKTATVEEKTVAAPAIADIKKRIAAFRRRRQP